MRKICHNYYLVELHKATHNLSLHGVAPNDTIGSIKMDKLFDNPAFWERERKLEAKCPRGEYEVPGEEENYSLCAPNNDPAVKAAKEVTKRRKNKISKRRNNPNYGCQEGV